MEHNTFAERLYSAMNDQNLKQVDFLRAAEQAGIKLGKSQMSQYVSGKAIPRKNIGQFLAQLLQVDVKWLYGQSTPSPEGEEITENGKIELPDIKGGISMREFKKSSKLDNVLYDVRGPVVEEATRMEESGTSVLKLNIGNPAPFGFRTPDEVIYDMQRQLTECEGYSAAKGLFSARKAIMQYAQIKKIPNLAIEDIYTGNGVSELINFSMSALLDNGDEVLVPTPDYP